LTVLATHATDVDGMYQEMEEPRRKHAKWWTGEGGTPDSAQKVESMLWVMWPLVPCVGVVLLFTGLKVFKRFYSRLAKDLETHSVSR